MASGAVERIKSQVADEFECFHTWRIRLKVVAGGKHWFVRQCVACGYREPHQQALVSLTDEEMAEALPVREDWHEGRRLDRQRRFWQLYAPIAEQLRAERRQAWWNGYNAYLASPEWKARRAAILERDPICGLCEHRPSTQVHHLTYARVRDELPEDLMGVCTPCHERLHGGRG